MTNDPLQTLGVGPNELGELERGAAYMELTTTHVRYQRTSGHGVHVYESAPLTAITSIRIMVDPASRARAIVLSVVAGALLALGALFLLLSGRGAAGALRLDGPVTVVGWSLVVLGALGDAAAVYLFKIARDRRAMSLEVATPTLALVWSSVASEDFSRLEEFAESIEAAQARLHGIDAIDGSRAESGEKSPDTLERAVRQATAARYGRG